jgi:uncharacterized integral membrane protein (TIGR00698 family)
MLFDREHRSFTLNGILFVALLALAAIFISRIPSLAYLKISPLIVGIVLGMVYGNTLRGSFPKEWDPGVTFTAKKILRLAIILYGFRITFQEISDVGATGLMVAVVMLSSTFLLGAWAGTKVFKLDRDTSLLTAAGSSICGAAAVLATEPVLKSESHKGATAVSTVVLFGTISMFLYPALYGLGVFNLAPAEYGVYVGGSVHEVAQVVAAGGAIPGAPDNAVIVKMTRVMLLAPTLILLGLYVSRTAAKGADRAGAVKLVIPWFAVGFIATAGINSLDILPPPIVHWIVVLDTFLLTMAMTALGMETSFKKLKDVGLKPFYVALVMFLWLLVGGYIVTNLALRLF